MPWQQQVADVALEIDPETNQFAYRQVVLTVPRQSGKTTLLLAIMVHRGLLLPMRKRYGRQRIVYTAQDRIHARQKWADEHIPILEASKFESLFSVRWQRGDEAIKWDNGSIHTLTAPTEKAVHGEVLDLGVIDEAFAREDERVEQGMKPAMITRTSPQLWIVSTAGDRKSVYLRKKVESGREAVKLGINRSVAYFEWSAPPDAEPGAEETWRSCMPALDHTIDISAIRDDFTTMDLDEFRRAYLNQWQEDSLDDWDVIPKSVWQGLARSDPPRPRRVAFAVDVNPDRTWATIGVAGQVGKDYVIEIDQHKRGTEWIIPRLKELKAKWKPLAIVIAPSSPAGSLIPEAEEVKLEILKPSARGVAHGCSLLYDASGANPKVLEPPRLYHKDQPELNAAVAGAERKDYGDIWLWARKGMSVDLSPLVAVTLALWGYDQKIHKVIRPFSFGDDDED